MPEKKKKTSSSPSCHIKHNQHSGTAHNRDSATAKKKKKSGTQRNKHTNSEGIRKERRQKGTKRKNRGARCFSHTRCAAHVELQSVTRNEGKRKKQHMRNQPSTDATVHRRKKP